MTQLVREGMPSPFNQRVDREQHGRDQEVGPKQPKNAKHEAAKNHSHCQKAERRRQRDLSKGFSRIMRA